MRGRRAVGLSPTVYESSYSGRDLSTSFNEVVVGVAFRGHPFFIYTPPQEEVATEGHPYNDPSCSISVRRLFAKFLLKRRLVQVNVQLTGLKH